MTRKQIAEKIAEAMREDGHGARTWASPDGRVVRVYLDGRVGSIEVRSDCGRAHVVDQMRWTTGGARPLLRKLADVLGFSLEYMTAPVAARRSNYALHEPERVVEVAD